MNAIVLAGGGSRRLGRDKALETLGGQTILKRVVDILLPLCERVFIATTGDRGVDRLPSHPALSQIQDLYAGRGPAGGLHAGLWISVSGYNLAIACDMPFLDTRLLRYLMEQAPGYDAVVPRVEGRPQTLHAVYSRACLEPLELLLNSWQRPGLHDLLPLVRVRYVEEEEMAAFEGARLSFHNVNTQADLEKARSLLETGPTQHRKRGVS